MTTLYFRPPRTSHKPQNGKNFPKGLDRGGTKSQKAREHLQNHPDEATIVLLDYGKSCPPEGLNIKKIQEIFAFFFKEKNLQWVTPFKKTA